MMNRSGIETYELLRLDEVALAGYFDLEDTRFEIGHRRLTNQKMLDLPGYGAVLAAVPDISKCNERDILQAIGFEQKGDRSLKEKAAIGRDGSKQLEAVRNREGLENFDGRDFR